MRPAAKSIRVVDLDPARPQLERGEITNIERAREQLRNLMAQSLSNPPGRLTPEKQLQSFLIAAAYRNSGKLTPLSNELTFVTDEQVMYSGSGKIVCDLLAIRTGRLGDTAVVIELKTAQRFSQQSSGFLIS